MLPVVAFDEAGNTGQNLLDPAQPVFALASVLLSSQHAEAVLGAAGIGTVEAHFAKLRRSRAGRKAILATLNAPAIRDDKVKISVIHKRFMITTKIVDILIETLIHTMGGNLYEQGANLGLANLLHTILPVFCGADASEALSDSFVNMVRSKTPSTIGAFFESVDRLIARNTNAEFGQTLAMLRATEAVIDDALGASRLTDIDPAVPAFVLLASEWTGQLREEFVILHDESKPIENDQQLLELLMTLEETPQLVGYDRRKGVLPILARQISFANSASHQELQIADIVASATAYLYSRVARGSLDDFAKEIGATALGQVTVQRVWPSTKVTPAELGTEEIGGIDPIEFTRALASRNLRKRRPPR